MTELETMERLEDSFENNTPYSTSDLMTVFSGKAYLANPAMNGSLDAAKALHEAVLEDRWSRSVDATFPADGISVELNRVPWCDTHTFVDADMLIESRAWLLAIIRALISEAKS